MESILNSVKKDLGIMPDYTHFDDDVIMCINTAFSVLTQIGVGPSEGFSISDDTTTWSDYLGSASAPRMELVKSYVAKKVRSIFDPPSSSSVNEALNKVISELEWRISVYVDPADTFPIT